MGVYIKGIEMPKRCGNCKFCVNMNEYPFKACFITYSGIPLGTDRLKNCPLVEIKTPHGRLIDADVMQRKAYEKNFDGIISDRELFLLNYYLEEKAQTILEAEEK